MNLSLDSAYELWQATLAGNSRRAYLADLRDLARFLREPSPLEAVRRLTSSGASAAYGLLIAWRQRLVADGLKPSTRNRRLASALSAIKFLNSVGALSWRVQVRPERLTLDLRNRVIPLPKLAEMIGLAGPREAALLWVLYGGALRVAEACALNWPGDVDMERGLVWFMGKQRVERESQNLPEPALAAIRALLAVRGTWPGPLFVSRTRQRLLTRDAYRHVIDLSSTVGLENVGPHCLRHTAITEAARALGGDLPAIMEYSRHSSPATALHYVHMADDSRRKTADAVGGALQAACQLAAAGNPAQLVVQGLSACQEKVRGANEGVLIPGAARGASLERGAP